MSDNGFIKPVAEVGQYVLLVDNVSYKLYQVAYIEGIPVSHPLVAEVTGGAGLAAGGLVAAFNTNTILDLNDGQLGHFRGFVLDDIHVQLLQPQALARYGLLNINATFNVFTRIEDPYDRLTEFFVLEDQRPFLRVTNPTGYALTQARVVFHGFKYILSGMGATLSSDKGFGPIKTFATPKEAVESGYKFAVVPTGGWSR